MGAVSKRIAAENAALVKENQNLRNENAALKAENVRLVHECRLAYLEGVDQGRAEFGFEEAC
jgi:cell division protein FtsB